MIERNNAAGAGKLISVVMACCGTALAACDSGQVNETSQDQPKQGNVAPLEIAPERKAPDATIGQRYNEQIRNIAENAKVQAAMEQIESRAEAARRLLIELTEIPAPPFHEEDRARRFADIMREIGLEEVIIDEVGNVIGRRPGEIGKKRIVISAHLDTVFPPGTDVTVRKEGNRLYAPGIADDTRGLVAVLEVVRAIVDSNIKTEADLLFVGTVGEEGLGDLRGVKHLFRESGQRIDAFMSLEPSAVSSITHAGVGSHRYRVTYEGPGGHSWHAFGLANPHHALGRAIAEFDKTAPAVSATEVKTSYNVGRIGGGTSVNSIPFESWMEVDMRSSRESKIEEMDAVFQSAIQTALAAENAGRAEGSPLTMDVEMVGDRPAGDIDPETPLVQRAMAAVTYLGFSPELRASSTDSNVPISMGIPAVTIGAGGKGENFHAPEEWWEDVDSHLGPQNALLILLASAGLRN